MDAIELIKQRRSVRNYKDQKVDHQTMTEIVELARWAPSWANSQIARYTLIDDDNIIKQIAEQGVNGFNYNINTLKTANGVAVLSYVKGKSGKKNQTDYATKTKDSWEVFDAGIACQTFCLAAHAKGVGTCIMGVIDHEVIAKLADIPAEETVAAIIVYGYEQGEHAQPNQRHEVSEILRFK